MALIPSLKAKVVLHSHFDMPATHQQAIKCQPDHFCFKLLVSAQLKMQFYLQRLRHLQVVILIMASLHNEARMCENLETPMANEKD